MEKGVGQVVVKIRSSRYTLIQPVVLLMLLIPPTFFNNTSFEDDRDCCMSR
jgi:hypothetical protein